MWYYSLACARNVTTLGPENYSSMMCVQDTYAQMSILDTTISLQLKFLKIYLIFEKKYQRKFTVYMFA